MRLAGEEAGGFLGEGFWGNRLEMEQMTQTGLVVASTKKGEMDLDLALKRVLAC